jgi:hypothetical protein
MLMSAIDGEVCRSLLAARRTVDRRQMGSYEAAMRRYEAVQRSLQRQGPGRRSAPMELPEPPKADPVSGRTVELFDTEMRLLFAWLTKRGYIPEDFWADIQIAKEDDRHVAIHMVPTPDQVWDIADVVASLDGGERYRVPILAAFELAPRPEELFAIETDWFDLDPDDPHITFRWAEVVVTKRYSSTGSRLEVRPLKHRAPGKTRECLVTDHLRPLIGEHLDRFATNGKFLSHPDGSPIIDRTPWQNRYLAPAVERVLGDSKVQELRELTLRNLRSAGITWWLRNGFNVKEAAEQSGHSPGTLLRYYAAATEQHRGEARQRLAAPSMRRGHLRIA